MHIILEKILVAIDFSEHSDAVLEQAMVLAADAPSAQLVLLWVDTRVSTQEILDGEVLGPESHELEPPRLHAEAQSKLDAFAARVEARQLSVVTRIERGYADETIARVAHDIGAALVLVGTHGRTGFKRLLLGSVAEKVVRTCLTNVLVMRGPARRFERILVATDFSSMSEHALQVALSLAGSNAHIDIVYAWQYPPGTRGLIAPGPKDGPLVEVRKGILRRSHKLGKALVERYRGADRTLSFEAVFGAPVEVLHGRLDEGDYQLVAMGTHGHRGFRRFLLGSVAEATVRHAPCPVLVAHEIPDDEEE